MQQNVELRTKISTALDMARALRWSDQMSIGYYAAGPCDTHEVPIRPPLDNGGYKLRKVIRKTRHLTFACADRHDELRSQSKSLLGTFRWRMDEIISELR